MRYWVIVILLVFTPVLSISQSRHIKKGDSEYSKMSYSLAIRSYLRAIDKGEDAASLYKKLGNSYYFNSDYENAHKWFEMLFKSGAKDIEQEYYYKYAQTLKIKGKLEQAKIILKEAGEFKSGDSRLQRPPNYIDSIKTQSSLYNLKNLNINSGASEFSPSISGQELMFSSARDTGSYRKLRSKWNKNPFLDLYAVPLPKGEDADFLESEIRKLEGKVNSKLHESSAVFTKDGKTIYFTRNNSKKGRKRRDSKGVVRLNIYKASLIDGKWTNVKALPFNKDSYSTAHPALSPDETKLYFASDMPGSFGMSDIYSVDILSNGSYGKPVNLGEEVNTSKRESFPFVSSKNNLYFASDGHSGMGGFDIFVSKILKADMGTVANLGKPINSPYDDFTFIINEESKAGYFASNRKGGKGKDDLYVFKISDDFEISCKKIITGLLSNLETNELLLNAAVTLLDEKGNELEAVKTNKKGEYLFTVDCEEEERIIHGAKLGFISEQKDINLGIKADTIKIDLKLIKEIETPMGGYDLAKLIQLGPIYFNFDSARIRKDAANELAKVAEVLINNPDLMVVVKSHTDSRGSAVYNKKLSERRAISTVDFIKANGVSDLRISGKGYGEIELVTDCPDGVRCSERKHQLNRRSEFLLANELIFTIQVGAVKSTNTKNAFTAVPDLMSYRYEDGFTRFYSGIFKNRADALKRQKELEGNGILGFVRQLQGNIIIK